MIRDGLRHPCCNIPTGQTRRMWGQNSQDSLQVSQKRCGEQRIGKLRHILQLSLCHSEEQRCLICSSACLLRAILLKHPTSILRPLSIISSVLSHSRNYGNGSANPYAGPYEATRAICASTRIETRAYVLAPTIMPEKNFCLRFHEHQSEV